MDVDSHHVAHLNSSSAVGPDFQRRDPQRLVEAERESLRQHLQNVHTGFALLVGEGNPSVEQWGAQQHNTVIKKPLKIDTAYSGNKENKD